jgi:predicted RNA-binding protein with EMAP domain
MSKTYNTIGSLSTLKSHLEDNNIYDFKSLKELIDFQSSFTTIRQQLITYHEKLIDQEKDLLKTELQQLEGSIEIQKQQSEKALANEIDKLKKHLNIWTNNTSTNIIKILTNRFCKYPF